MERAKKEKDRKAAERLASQSIVDGLTKSAEGTLPHEQLLVGETDQLGSQQRTVARTSAPQGGSAKDEENDSASTPSKQSEPSSASISMDNAVASSSAIPISEGDTRQGDVESGSSPVLSEDSI